MLKQYKRIFLALALCAGVLHFPLTAFAEYGDYGETYTPEYGYGTGQYTGYNYYDDTGCYTDINAVWDTLDISAIFGAIFGGGLSGPGASPGHLTPDGTGTVLDNVYMYGSGLEFFTFTTDAGNVFYLVIDRTRESGNVFFLNAVTEWDLLALAQAEGGTPPGGGHTVSGIPPAQGGISPDPNAPGGTDDEPEAPEEPPANRGGINGTVIFILIAAAVFGGVAYYFKILLPKKRAASDDDDEGYDDPDDGDEDDDYLSYGGDDADSGIYADDDEKE